MRSARLKVALAQMNMRWEDKKYNQAICSRLAAQAARRRADLIIFPEMTLTGFAVDNPAIAEDARKSPTVAFFQQLARAKKIAIVFGAVFHQGSKRRNMAIAVDKRGKVLASYQKMHLFSYGGEGREFSPGKKITFFTLNGLVIAPLICYDLRFPGLFEAASQRRPDAVIVIANWPAARIQHWQTLLPARALDLQSYVIGVNRVGKGDGLQYLGRSAVYSPRGEKLLEMAGAGIKIVTLHQAAVKETRRDFSSLRDKRPKAYRQL